MNTFNINRVLWIDGRPFVECSTEYVVDYIEAQNLIDNCEE